MPNTKKETSRGDESFDEWMDVYMSNKDRKAIKKYWRDIFKPDEIDLNDMKSVLAACNKAARFLGCTDQYWSQVHYTEDSL